MAKQKVDSFQAVELQQLVGEYDDLDHLRVRARADLLTLESGPEDNPFRHARLRRVMVQYYQLEMPTNSRWELTPFRGPMEEVVAILVDEFGWTLEPVA